MAFKILTGILIVRLSSGMSETASRHTSVGPSSRLLTTLCDNSLSLPGGDPTLLISFERHGMFSGIVLERLALESLFGVFCLLFFD